MLVTWLVLSTLMCQTFANICLLLLLLLLLSLHPSQTQPALFPLSLYGNRGCLVNRPLLWFTVMLWELVAMKCFTDQIRSMWGKLLLVESFQRNRPTIHQWCFVIVQSCPRPPPPPPHTHTHIRCKQFQFKSISPLHLIDRSKRLQQHFAVDVWIHIKWWVTSQELNVYNMLLFVGYMYKFNFSWRSKSTFEVIVLLGTSSWE